MADMLPRLRLIDTPVAPQAATLPRRDPRERHVTRRPLGQILIDMKAIAPDLMHKALRLRERRDVRIGDILLAHGWAEEGAIMRALALQWGAQVVDLAAAPPDVRLLDGFGAAFCLAEGLVPWRRVGAATVVATARPEDFRRARQHFPASAGQIIMALAPERAIHAALVGARQTSLIRRAECRVAEAESCRTLSGQLAGRLVLALAAVTAGVAAFSPALAVLPYFVWAVLTLVLCAGLKAAAFVSELRAGRAAVQDGPAPAIARLPVVSVMVPLFHEDDIAPSLIRRLGRLDYPKELLDIILVVEEDDLQTQRALARHRLPHWMRTVIVPRGPIRTKPRALNYALDFCRGSIIGVYDAEDAPDPGQIHAIVRRFHERGPDVACLQGILDFYNARHNWLTRCFAIEYAAWFRVMLPGIARLGFVVPLGGTTLFFRRDALVALGGWDAHNVTEDADLGVRLARHGYRTELVRTVTEEEPNSRPLPWIKQRSRWLKGYAMTWAVHMRDPVRLWRDLGPKRFFGMQVMFFGTLSQYVLAPVLWSFWALALGLGHPLAQILPPGAVVGLSALFLLSEVLNIVVGVWAVRGPAHRHLTCWVPTLHFYFPLGALASYKAVWELMKQPFFWDKTRHGVLLDTEGQPEPEETPRLPVLVLTNPIQKDAALSPVDQPGVIFARSLLGALAIAPPVARPLEIALTPGRPGVEFQTSFEGF